MSANLTRLNDLAAELSNQLEPLGDQAESAATARELQARIRELHGILITRETHALNAQVQEQTRRLSDTIEQAHELDESREKNTDAAKKPSTRILNQPAASKRRRTLI